VVVDKSEGTVRLGHLRPRLFYSRHRPPCFVHRVRVSTFFPKPFLSVQTALRERSLESLTNFGRDLGWNLTIGSTVISSTFIGLSVDVVVAWR
jgi:hypothetical protein